MGDAAAVGDGISELRIHYGPGYRVYFKRRGQAVIILLCGGDKSTQAKEIETASGWRRNGANNMAERLTVFDPAEGLTSEEAVAAFMAEAFASEDAGYIAHALGVVA